MLGDRLGVTRGDGERELLTGLGDLLGLVLRDAVWLAVGLGLRRGDLGDVDALGEPLGLWLRLMGDCVARGEALGLPDGLRLPLGDGERLADRLGLPTKGEGDREALKGLADGTRLVEGLGLVDVLAGDGDDEGLRVGEALPEALGVATGEHDAGVEAVGLLDGVGLQTNGDRDAEALEGLLDGEPATEVLGLLDWLTLGTKGDADGERLAGLGLREERAVALGEEEVLGLGLDEPEKDGEVLAGAKERLGLPLGA
jgi:hypothetical protein